MIEVVRRLIEIQEQLALVKELYKEQDALLEVLISRGFTYTVVDGHVASLIDNFDAKNVVFKACGVRRYELLVQTMR